ncbi:hypothetical protein JTE90_002676 [Oedothorax gibbosus]|uniref:DNA 5'-3' helicase n=1 Tax=Oedothorax gibbosus TaxID=931172 RepID=A0AAV6TXZ2_9ARAC|nr:hypothetical protein JTE90_002676 [Oedothorax gibbosus]
MESPTVNNSGSKFAGTDKMTSSKAYTIGGVPIMFPYRAYPSQITMMDKIVKCLNKKDNCLLESPTGSGKSLALLCACLGWQKKCIKVHQDLEMALEENASAIRTEKTAADNLERAADEARAKELLETFKKQTETENINESFTKSVKNENLNESIKIESPGEAEAKLNSTVQRLKARMQKKEQSKRHIVYLGDDGSEDMEDFKPTKKFRSSFESVTAKPLFSTTPESGDTVKENLDARFKSLKCSDCSCDKGEEPEKTPMKIPTIYFGTRTHKQVAQIISELKKTPYRDTPMTILSSRERTCIHPSVKGKDNKNEACEELLKQKGGPGCHFYRNSKKISHFSPSHLSDAFDLQEFVNICRRARACPYYSARELLSGSHIVFCPYNYLVDPLIRSALKINMKDSILVMDEAHNIEDSARDAATGTLSLAQLESAVSNLEFVAKSKKEKSECYRAIAKVLTNLVKWLKANADSLTDYSSFDSSTKVWSGDELIAIMNILELGPQFFPNFITSFEAILEEENDKENLEMIQDMDEFKLLGATISCGRTLVQTLTYLYKNELIYVPDYRFCVTKRQNQFRGRRSLPHHPFELTLQFLCLNPGVAFSDLRDVTHSIIVASGTLSPLTSFESELGVPFKLTLEANHVVSSDKTWVGTIGRGPNNTALSATFSVASTYDFQDDVGQLVYEVCSVIPHGVLCFLPSYGMLEKLAARWKQTGMWGKLESLKVVVQEPRRQGEFEQVIDRFYSAVNENRHGALLFAVCRGKVSEGIDFADNFARAVITIGIPFPNYKDAQVDLKKKYNDKYSEQRKLMKGSEWYETQAFRALNQALGRCIRHRNDFGALIIVDERFQKNKQYPLALSKWIRGRMEHFQSFSQALTSLNAFAERTGLKEAICDENDCTSKEHTFKGHSESVDQLCWHPSNPDLLSTASLDKTVRIWDAKSQRSIANIQTKGENINICWSPNGQTIAVGNKEDLVTFIDVRTHKIIADQQFKFEVNELSWNMDNSHFFLTNGQGCIYILSYPDLQIRQILNAHPANCICIEFDKTGKYFATGSVDALVSLWDVETLVCVRTFSRLEWPVRTISFSYDGNMLASASEDHLVDIADVNTGEKIAEVPCESPTFTVAWHPKKHLLAFACDDKDKHMRERDAGTVKLFGLACET